MAVKDARKVEWLDVPDISPDCTLIELASWILKALESAATALRKSPDRHEIEAEALCAAIEMSRIEGFCSGASQALVPFSEHSLILGAAVTKRLAEVAHEYEIFRLQWVEAVCRLTIKATAIFKHLPRGGRARKGLPNYDAPNFKSADAWEFDIAVKVMEQRVKTGKFSGIVGLVDEAVLAGRLPADYDVKRAKRLAKNLYENSALFLPPALVQLRASAAERVRKSAALLGSQPF